MFIWDTEQKFNMTNFVDTSFWNFRILKFFQGLNFINSLLEVGCRGVTKSTANFLDGEFYKDS